MKNLTRKLKKSCLDEMGKKNRSLNTETSQKSKVSRDPKMLSYITLLGYVTYKVERRPQNFQFLYIIKIQ